MTEVRLIPLRCPGCLAQVNVEPTAEVAKCRMCGTAWNWRRAPKRIALALVPARKIRGAA